MRVLVVNDLPLEGGPGTGGAEVYTRRLVTALRDAGDDVSVFARAAARGPLSRSLTLWDPIVGRALGRRVAEFRPDVVHFNNVFRELSAAALSACSGVPSVMTVHDLRVVGVTMGAGSRLRNVVDRRVKQPLDTAAARRHVDVMLPVSADIRARLDAAGFPIVRQLPVIVPPPTTAPPVPSSSRTVAFVGRLSADKGVDVLFAAWPRIVAAVPDARLVVVGDGPERDALTAQAQRLASVTLLGRLEESEVSATLSQARLLAVPSLPAIRPEGAPLVVVEAAAHGRPVVTSDDPGLVELDTRLGHGMHTPAGDAAALADAVVRLLTDDELADRLGAAGRHAAADYAPARVVDLIRATYAEAIASAGRH